ncbi:hypothetical protein GGE45_003747 [Rhizobium aethiopicum]|uniref:Uncharacterized protein n=1 Tax=Rhizobium aethiopicum TaxID=1138170 RepID=A0A7W6VQI4_9HYPH|nr:hypothetical protein [Rhizobium aethiopicum]MBB4194129.1 hypothetical protein [Rhizobium aethiopicum]MBB4581399.1 hypothetical protein [Rhizobium aethiopicum]
MDAEDFIKMIQKYTCGMSGEWLAGNRKATDFERALRQFPLPVRRLKQLVPPSGSGPAIRTCRNEKDENRAAAAVSSMAGTAIGPSPETRGRCRTNQSRSGSAATNIFVPHICNTGTACGRQKPSTI